jgi:hypothetical protein
MRSAAPRLIRALRLAGLIVLLAAAFALLRVMAWLPWQVDAVLAAMAVLAFAYWYEGTSTSSGQGDDPR